MTDTPATIAARRSGISHTVVRYGAVRSIEEAAAARQVDLEAMVKTLAVRSGDADVRLVAVPGDRVIAWPKLRTHLGLNRVAMVDAGDLEDLTGYVRGTVTPFGTTTALPLIVDAALLDVETLSIGGGAGGVALHLAPRDLVAAFDADVADVTRPMP